MKKIIFGLVISVVLVYLFTLFVSASSNIFINGRGGVVYDVRNITGSNFDPADATGPEAIFSPAVDGILGEIYLIAQNTGLSGTSPGARLMIKDVLTGRFVATSSILSGSISSSTPFVFTNSLYLDSSKSYELWGIASGTLVMARCPTTPSPGCILSNQTAFKITSGSAQAVINISNPVDGSATYDFVDWLVQAHASGTAFSGMIDLSYSSSSLSSLFTSSSRIDSVVAYFPTSTGAYFFYRIPKSVSLCKSVVDCPKDYYAQARVRDNFGNVVSTSSQIAFTTNWSSVVVPFAGYVPTSTLSNATSVVKDLKLRRNCEGEGEGFLGLFNSSGYAWCQFVKSFLEPSDYALGTVSDAMTSFKTVPPFNVVFESVSELQNVATTTDFSSSSLSVTLPYGKGTFTFLTGGMLEQSVGPTLKNSIFDFLEALIWVASGIIILSFVI